MGKQETTFIYALCCPITGGVRYIGKTNDPKYRLRKHTEGINRTKTKKNSWFKSLQKKGVSPTLEILDTISSDEWIFWEQHYISLYRSWGFNLTNGTLGGDGLNTPTEFVKNKISNSAKSYYKKIKELINSTPQTKEDEIKKQKAIDSEEKRKKHLARMSELGRKSPIFKDPEYKKRKSDRNKRKIAVAQYDLNWNYIKTHKSILDTQKEGYAPKSVSAVLNGRDGKRTHKGFNWRKAIIITNG